MTATATVWLRLTVSTNYAMCKSDIAFLTNEAYNTVSVSAVSAN